VTVFSDHGTFYAATLHDGKLDVNDLEQMMAFDGLVLNALNGRRCFILTAAVRLHCSVTTSSAYPSVLFASFSNRSISKAAYVGRAVLKL